MTRERKKLILTRDSRVTAAQHKAPCQDCPWARESLSGWLGPMTANEWLQAAHGEGRIDCHTLKGSSGAQHQCAGSAIYRANVAKLCRDPDVLRAAPDKVKVFGWPGEFKSHHEDDR